MIRSSGRPRRARALLVLLVPSLLLAACSEGGGEARPVPSPAQPSAAGAPAATPAAVEAAAAPTREDLYARGRSVYMGNCTACHAMDPTQVGSLGPEVAGSSRELLEARIIHNTYPPGYTPKRETGLMVALPHLKDDIDALAVYLAGEES